MHLIYLGVVKRLLLFWTKGNKNVRLNPTDINKINNSLFKFRKVLSSKNFSRLPHSVSKVERWKATEFRQFLCYTGPIVLENSIRLTYYNYFLSLHCAARILESTKLCVKYICQ